MKNNINKSDDVVPKVFEFNIGSCLDLNNFSVKIENGRIVPARDYLLFPNFDNDYIIPTVEEWENFWKKLYKIGAQFFTNFLKPVILME
jgi:hypothetical protein